LVPKPAKTAELEKKTTVSSITELNDLILGATLDEELHALLLNETDRETLRKMLVETYFAPELQDELLAQGEINIKAFQYSLELVEPKNVPKVKNKVAGYSAPIRDQGFRLALVKAYNHRCTVCGICALTPEGHTVIEAAHIIPWSISHDDNPRNGVALCKVCHWMFDEGLLTISSKYIVIISPQLSADQNIPGHLVTLEGRGIIEPINKIFLPEMESLIWHYREVFRAKREELF
jgi:putative restriction endonuclease